MLKKSFVLFLLIFCALSFLSSQTANDYIRSGINLNDNDDYEEAINEFDLAKELDPNNAIALSNAI